MTFASGSPKMTFASGSPRMTFASGSPKMTFASGSPPGQQQQQVTRLELPADENIQLEELEDFAKEFKQRRIKLGYTQVHITMLYSGSDLADFLESFVSIVREYMYCTQRV